MSSLALEVVTQLRLVLDKHNEFVPEENIYITDEADNIIAYTANVDGSIQIYDGHGLDLQITGIDGRYLGAYAGIALEPQLWPDSPNRLDFTCPLLHPGEVYLQHTQYQFLKK